MARRISVTVAEDHLGRIGTVTEQLRANGMKVDQVLEAIGIITGAADELGPLRSVAGVASVDEAQAYRVPPPDEDVQ